ncbi:MAG: RNase adapter RapZ [Xanthomonadales bacterium]|nr:RNase adapter RapZ [Xanthomonadales bacterium]NIN59053.1 RNase adapter RapZ [Xanthomonadales bacterium]NIN74357.1 RNase adapter RapZ [Xanthomonadales bacterium]NIO13942.1 RNase adapter RapZ [Xanthomonadales bacterium]NIP11446.1 RNase adapter RapZ [Xanthomonadales bacterium]
MATTSPSETGDQRVIIVSGLSGGGKSTALKALEDLGYYCIDNLPAALLAEFGPLIQSQPALYQRVALGIDARARGSDFSDVPRWIDTLQAQGPACRLLFLTAEPKALIQRFSETRRRHPLTQDEIPLPKAIELERELLEPLQQRADWVLDTTRTNIHDLRHQVRQYLEPEQSGMTVVLQSFAFKKGVPSDVDFLFDARNLPNPYWQEHLRALSGLDQAVAEWLGASGVADRMAGDILGFLTDWLPGFADSQRSYVTVGIGCTGGRHRSVYLVERVADALRAAFPRIMVHHRELEG